MALESNFERLFSLNKELQFKLLCIALFDRSRRLSNARSKRFAERHHTRRLKSYQDNNARRKAVGYFQNYRSKNKVAIRSRIQAWEAKNQEKVRARQHRFSKTPKAKARFVRYRKRHPEKVAQTHKNYVANNAEKVKAATAAYRAKNAEIIKTRRKAAAPQRRAYNALRWNTDPIFKLTKTLRLRIRQSMKHRTAQQRALLLLGCTVEEFRKYIEVQFQPGMSWDNFGDKGWHLDHVKPIAAHNLSDPEQVKSCFHFSNHQPLWWEDNLRKGAKILPRAWNGNHGLSRRIARRDAQAPAKLLTAIG